MSRSFTPGMMVRQREVRQHRHGQAARHHREADCRVVGAVADVRLEPAELLAGAAGHLVPAQSRVPGGPGLARQLGERHGFGVAARRRMARRQAEAHGIAEQVVALHARGQLLGLVLPLVSQHEVDVAQRQPGEGLLRLQLHQLAAQPRRLPGQRLHRRQREPQRHRLEPGDAAAAGHRSRGRRQVGLRKRRPLQQRPRVLHQDQRRIGQAHAAPGAFDERDARLALEHRQLLRDGRGRELKRVRHRGDRPSGVQLAQKT